MRVTVGVCAYNEGRNIGRLLERLVEEPLANEVIVVASGCTDDTVLIASSEMFKPKVKVIVQPTRDGKASAVNAVIAAASSEIIILEGADTIPARFCYRNLLKHFESGSVGMVGARPIPTNDPKTKMGKLAHLLWTTHHLSAVKNPKAGEVVAFRNIVRFIDKTSLVDEADIEAKIVARGYRVEYEPDAVVFNRGPETVPDFIRQRRRIYLGHLILEKTGYRVPTMKTKDVVVNAVRASGLDVATLVRGGWLEMKSRYLAAQDLESGNSVDGKWDMVGSTKEVK